MRALHGSGLEALVLGTLVKELDAMGSLHALLQGFKFYAKTFRLAHFEPAHGASHEVLGRTYGVLDGLTPLPRR